MIPQKTQSTLANTVQLIVQDKSGTQSQSLPDSQHQCNSQAESRTTATPARVCDPIKSFIRSSEMSCAMTH